MGELDTIADSIIEDPEKNFTRFLYDSTEEDLILILNKVILNPEKGHSTVIQCLLCWQVEFYLFFTKTMFDFRKNFILFVDI